MQKLTISTLKNFDLKTLSTERLSVLEAKLAVYNANLRGVASSIGAQVPVAPALTDTRISREPLLVSVKNQITHSESLLAILGEGAEFLPTFEFAADCLSVGGNQSRPAAVGHKLGGLSAAVLQKPGATANLTEKILAAKGVKSLEELRAKNSDFSPEQLAKQARGIK